MVKTCLLLLVFKLEQTWLECNLPSLACARTGTLFINAKDIMKQQPDIQIFKPQWLNQMTYNQIADFRNGYDQMGNEIRGEKHLRAAKETLCYEIMRQARNLEVGLYFMGEFVESAYKAQLARFGSDFEEVGS